MAFDQIQLEKGMYREAGKSFTQVLESLDPSENYKGTALENTDAFQRQLKRFGIRVRGKGSDRVEKFFSTASSAVLFPEFISRVVRSGMEEDDLLPSLIATTTYIDAMDYRTIYASQNQNEYELARVSEGAEIPTVKLSLSDSLTRLYKRGRLLEASYEAQRFQKQDLFSVYLRQIGNAIQKTHLEDAVTILLDGTESQVPGYFEAGDEYVGGESDEVSYGQLVNFWLRMQPYQMTTMLAGQTLAQQILMLPQMQDAVAGLAFHGNGKMITPLGAQLHVVPTSMIGENIIGLDRRYTLEMVRAGDVAVEFDKLIDRQLERAAVTSIAGFNLIYGDATGHIEYSL